VAARNRFGPTVRLRLLFILAIVVPLGLATKFYAGPAEVWVHAHAGGFLYVVFWCLLALAIWPQTSPWVVGIVVLLITSALEFLQLWHPPVLQAIRSTFFGHALIGSSFSWSDFPYYVAGMLSAAAIARFCGDPRPPSRQGAT
jgi:hypothetical protein